MHNKIFIILIVIIIGGIIGGIFFLALKQTKKSASLEREIQIINHRFVPDKITVPTKTKIILTIKNEDTTVEEFDSIELRREKIIPGKSKAHITLAPLKAGVYNFIGEFHEETAKGQIIVIDTDN